MNDEIKFFGKVIRNSAILASLYFISVWAGNDLTWEIVKPIIIFFIGYIAVELGTKYKLITRPGTAKKGALMPLIF